MADALHRHSELSASDGTPDQALKVNATGDIIIAAAKKFFLDGESDTYIYESASNVMTFVAGTSPKFEVNTGGAGTDGQMKVGDNIFMGTGQFYLGATDSNTDGTWRIFPSGDDLLFQQRETGTWTTKFTMSGA